MSGETLAVFKRLARTYHSPRAVQRLLDTFDYNKSETMRSALTTFKLRSGHCLEAVFVAAAILEQRGYPPLVLSIDSADHIGHVVFVFKEKGLWGAIGRSREPGLHGRAPVFRSIRDLTWSYVDPYVDDTGGKVLAYALANLDDSKSRWRTAPGNVWKCERFILSREHVKLRASAARHRRSLRRYRNGGHIPRDYWW